jgi:hypothetical protein
MPLFVVGRQLPRPAGRTARRHRPASLLASGSWPQGSGPAWDWPSSGLGVGPAPTRRAVCDMVLASDAWPGGLPCPGTGGRWTPWHARQGQAIEPTKSARSGSGCRACSAQVPGWLVGRLRLGWSMPAPSGQLPRGGKRGSRHGAAVGPREATRTGQRSQCSSGHKQ